MASAYETKAAEWRKEAAFTVRWRLRTGPATRPEGRGEEPMAVKMEKHCMAIVKDARSSPDAEWAAQFHRERAKEVAGR